MTKVTSLAMYRQAKNQQTEAMLRETRDLNLSLEMDDVVGRDYTKLADVVHGILRLKTILTTQLGPMGEWPSLLLDILAVVDRGIRTESLHSEDLATPCRLLAEHIEDRLNVANQLSLGSALVMLSFIENAPRVRNQLKN